MKKLKSFTLLEMMIALILTVVVVSMSYICYKIVFRQMVIYKNMSDRVSGTSQFHTILQSDFYKSDFVRNNQGEIIFTFSGNPEIKYYFKEDYVLRKSGSTVDTFFIAGTNLKKKFLHSEQEKELGLIDEFSFDAKLLNEDELFNYAKAYGAADLIAEEKNDLP